MTLIDSKRALRAAMSARRRHIGDEERRQAADSLLATLRRERPFPIPCAVSAFWPVKDEIDIRPLMIDLFQAGCRIALPVVQGRGERLLFRVWEPGDMLEAGPFGTFHPSQHCDSIEPDALLVPLLACDRDGWRLGYGGGFYDRTLLALRTHRQITAVGVGFDMQFLPEVPRGADDQRLDWLLTDRRACAFV